MKHANLKKIGALLLCLVLTVTSFAACGKKGEEPETATKAPETETEAPQPIGTWNPLTGEDNLDAKMVGKRPIAIMVENSPQARPQWGLSTPDIVIEGLVEGGITRMMWLYADVNKVPKVGPTRSARHDYVELAEGMDAIYTHFGGSSYAYDAIKRDGVKDIDGTKGDGAYFKRDTTRKVDREHTAYTNGEMLAKAIEAKKMRTDVKKGAAPLFMFADETRTLSGGACKSIQVVFSQNYKHTFTFENGLYVNHMNKNVMKDANGDPMRVTNVLILYCGVSPVQGSNKGHVDWDLSGGKGVYVTNGTMQNITWKKGAPNAPLQLRNADGKPLELNKGKSYIGFVPTAQAKNTVIA